MVSRESEFCICGCGRQLAGKQKRFASTACNRRWRRQTQADRALKFCLCGCGQRVKGKFYQEACRLRYERQQTIKGRTNFCLCGCGKKLTGRKRKFASEACKRRWRVNNLVYPDKYQRKQDIIASLALADMVFDFELENSGSGDWSEEIRKAKLVLGDFCKELKARPGVAILVPKPDNSRAASL